jgi:hypothetical protein
MTLLRPEASADSFSRASGVLGQWNVKCNDQLQSDAAFLRRFAVSLQLNNL